MISILIALWVFWSAATAGVLVAAYLATRGGRQAPEGAVVGYLMVGYLMVGYLMVGYLMVGYLMAGTLAVIGVIAWTLVR